MSNENDKRYALLGDSPVLDQDRPVDLLDFEKAARILAGATTDTDAPLTIGVFGDWGSGKTSLMKLIQQQVEKSGKAAAVWFNAWQYQNEDHLILPLLATIDKELQKSAWAQFADGAKKVQNLLRSLVYMVSFKAKIGIPGVVEVGVDGATDKGIKRYEDLENAECSLSSGMYFQAFEELSQAAKTGKLPRTVVFVDDLDRCLPPKAMALLENIKLVLHQPKFSFVLGVNEKIIQEFVANKFEKEYGIAKEHAKDYFHKIAQVEFHVPHREAKDMVKFISALLQKADVTFADDVTKSEEAKAIAIPLIAEATKHNPRSVVRLLNAMIVESRLAEEEDGEKKCDLLALVIEVVTKGETYNLFRRLAQRLSAENKTIGEWIADSLETYAGRFEEWGRECKEKAKGLNSTSLEKIVDLIQANEHIWRLLSFPAGLNWLRDEKYRSSLGRFSERALEDVVTGKAVEKTPAKKDGGPIEELLRNLVSIPAGEFTMGSPDDEEGRSDDEGPQREVRLDAFQMGKYPVTQEQYEAVMSENPSHFKGPDNPVESVSWHNAREFCEKLSAQTGQEFILPTEAQWEYACRAGTKTRFCFDESKEKLDDYAWYDGNSENKTHPVGEKKGNGFDLYDMHGNVWEWCLDHWHDTYDKAPKDGSAWVTDDADALRVLRGGSWNLGPQGCRSAFRRWYRPTLRYGLIGFRVVGVGRTQK